METTAAVRLQEKNVRDKERKDYDIFMTNRQGRGVFQEQKRGGPWLPKGATE